MSSLGRSILCVSALVGLVAPAPADVIRLRSGEEIEARVVVEEGLELTIYRDRSNKNQELPTADIASIEYERKPELLEEAEVSLADGNVAQAIYELDLFLEAFLGPNPDIAKRQPWAPAWAANTVVELHQASGNHAKVVTSADRVIQSFATSRFAPAAWLAKARAQSRFGSEEAALATLDAFETFAAENGLADRWLREAELGRVLYDGGLEPEAKLERLVALEEQTAGAPEVQQAVQLALGEAYLVLADVEQAQRPAHLSEAKGWFENVLASEDVGDALLAGAKTGLGDVAYLTAKADQDEAGLREARLLYMQVVVLYEEQVEYVPRAMYFAAVASKELHDITNDEEERLRQRKLATRLRQRYKTSKWADDARSLLR